MAVDIPRGTMVAMPAGLVITSAPSPSPPRRAFHLTLTVQADTEAELFQVLGEYARELGRMEIPRGPTRSAMGGVTCGASYELDHDPTMTHDRYCRELDAYLGKDHDGE